MTLAPSPACSPELDPAERWFSEFRRSLADETFETIGASQEAARENDGSPATPGGWKPSKRLSTPHDINEPDRYNFTEKLSCLVIFFQGLEDEVVPPNQAEKMVEALREKGAPVAYVPFEGEQHGFRKAENIERALDAELYFYSRVLGLELADEVEPVEIENL